MRNLSGEVREDVMGFTIDTCGEQPFPLINIATRGLPYLFKESVHEVDKTGTKTSKDFIHSADEHTSLSQYLKVCRCVYVWDRGGQAVSQHIQKQNLSSLYFHS